MWYNCGTTFATTHTLPCGPYCLRCLRCFRLRALACNLFSIPVQAIANRCTCSLLNSFRFYTLCLSPFGCGGTVARVSALVRWSAVRWCVGALVGTNCQPHTHTKKKNRSQIPTVPLRNGSERKNSRGTSWISTYEAL